MARTSKPQNWVDIHSIDPVLNMRIYNARTVADYLDALVAVGKAIGFNVVINPDAGANNVVWQADLNSGKKR